MASPHGQRGMGLVPLTGYAVAQMMRSAAGLALPVVLAHAVTAVLTTSYSTGRPIWLLAGCLLLLGAGDALVALTSGYATALGTARLRVGLVRHLLTLGAADRLQAGDTISRVVYAASDAAAAPVAVVSACIALAASATAVVLIWMVDWRSGTTFTVLTPLVMVAGRGPLSSLAHQQSRYLSAQGEISSRLLSALNGSRTIRSAGTARQEIERILAPLRELTEAGRGLWGVQRRLVCRVRMVVALLQAATLATAGLSLEGGFLRPGDLVAIVGLVALALAGIDQIDTVSGLVHSAASRRRLSDAFKLPQARTGARQLNCQTVAVTWRNVSVDFAGSGLHGVSVHLPAGESLAVVGPSGSGKSTFAALAGGLVLPDQGEVLLAGIPVHELDPAVLHRTVSYAFDTPALLGSTLAEAICYPNPVEPNQVRAAAHMARADGFIQRLPAGYGTTIDAAPMSGGELQRIGLARALATEAPVLVLDDAMTGLDTVTEAEIRQVITSELPGRTRLLVARNAETAASCDRVVWLEDGRVKAVGTHTELWCDRNYRAVFAESYPSEAIA